MPKKNEQVKKYYNLDRLLKVYHDDQEHVRYLLSFGKRGAGKSYSAARLAIQTYMKGKVAGIARRYDDDWRQNVASTYFDSLIANGVVRKETGGEWDGVYYYGHRWYFTRYDEEEDKVIKSEEPFAYAFALNTWEKTKASQYPKMSLLIMEEFITDRYIGAENREFSMFLNLVSTLKRDRDDFLCILLGNSIQREGNPYFKCMGIENRVLEMKPGDLVVFKSDDSPLRIAVEFTPPPGSEEKTDPMFAFTDSAAARMITQGDWQIERHFPELPEGTRILPKDRIFSYYVRFRIYELRADIILRGDQYFTYYHKNEITLTEEQERDALIFDLDYHLEHNYRRDITRPTDPISQQVANFFKKDAVYVQDVEVGEILYSYIQSL